MHPDKFPPSIASTMHRTFRFVAGLLVVLIGLSDLGRATELDHSLFQALRSGDLPLLTVLLREGSPVNVVDAAGNTPLLIAARDGDAEAVRLLLEQGAEPNAANKIGVTPLLWAAGDPDKVRLLLARGANPNARSALGVTPLIAAAAYPASEPVVALLLEAGASATHRSESDETALSAAAAMGNLESVRLLLARGADAKAGFKPWSVLHSKKPKMTEIVGLLLDGGADVNRADGFAGHALNYALLNELFDVAELLVQRGARLDLATPEGKVPTVVLTAYTEVDHDRMAKLLLERGAEIGAKAASNETALHWAKLRGHSLLPATLSAAGAPDCSNDDGPAIPQRRVKLHAGNQDELLRAAIAKSLDLLQRSSDGFLRERGNCVSCHQQNLPAVALAWARDRGFEIRGSSVAAMIDVQQRSWSPRIEHAYQLDDPQPGGIEQIGYGLWANGALGAPADETSRAMVWYVASQQFQDGRWAGDLVRPPSEGPDVLATVLGIRTLQLYPLAGRREEFAERIERAAVWLRALTPATHQEKALRLLGLAWAGDSAEELKGVAQDLLADQREDGGWAQLAGLSSDAYATGQSLVALKVAGTLDCSDDSYQRGLEFLLSTQFDDGAWFVRTRTWPFQPPFESGFPFGKHQWISAPATAWAAMALTLAVEPKPGVPVARLELPAPETPPTTPAPSTPSKDAETPAVAYETIDFARDIKPLFERSCMACHGGYEAKGGFRVNNRANLLAGGESEAAAVVAGKSDESLLLRLVSDQVSEREMPPLLARDKYPALKPSEIELLRRWIDQGAEWPEETDGPQASPEP